MDFRDSPDEAAFRERLSGWLTEQKGKFPTSGDEYWAAQGDWHKALYQAGFFGTSWPKELLYSERMSTMLRRFSPEASEVLQLAVRCQQARHLAHRRNRRVRGQSRMPA